MGPTPGTACTILTHMCSKRQYWFHLQVRMTRSNRERVDPKKLQYILSMVSTWCNFCLQDGTIMAAADRFWVNITGKGGHAAMPHLSIDPVVAASQVRALS